MKIENHMLKLAGKKSTCDESQELDDFLEKEDPEAFAVLRLLADLIIDEPASKEDINRSFAKLTERIKSAESHQVPQITASTYKRQPKRKIIIYLEN
ncbi:hypothetical protein KXD93_14200 [Mucilaginibacter sp. BJC16-A38]|uniref:hypothetical protein n=1 Tax=Mucilaginibacter phenanthrenivorans TaxID=1234842 RepID=UPI0021575206|nr:hypothetical protein [Mucilaginibacter phenanthrenivorans]MCR8558806.1 hypothetical protein [Mucilaginibacter phenanthrenivorans]